VGSILLVIVIDYSIKKAPIQKEGVEMKAGQGRWRRRGGGKGGTGAPDGGDLYRPEGGSKRPEANQYQCTDATLIMIVKRQLQACGSAKTFVTLGRA
jgi:hypothetical protein